jgi:hypothetical protein
MPRRSASGVGSYGGGNSDGLASSPAISAGLGLGLSAITRTPPDHPTRTETDSCPSRFPRVAGDSAALLPENTSEAETNICRHGATPGGRVLAYRRAAVHKRVVVNLAYEAFDAILWAQHGPLSVLRDAKLLPPGAQPW